MKTTHQEAISNKKCVYCVLCGGCIDKELEYLIWAEKESRFWLCQRCSYLMTGEPANTEEIPHPRQP